MNTDIHTIFSAGDCPPHELLLAYFRGELTGEEKNRIEQHLMQCEMCSDELGGLTKMKDVDKLPGIVAEIQSEIKARQRKIIRMNPRILITAAAATVVILIGVVFLFRFIPSREGGKLLSRQKEQPITMEMQNPVPPPDSRGSPSGPAASAGKPLLAVVQPPKKKDAIKEQEKIVPVTTEEIFADEEPREEKPPADSKTIIVQHQDSAIQPTALGFASGIATESVSGKGVAMQPPALVEEKSDMGKSDKKRSGFFSDDPAMILYHKADYQQASILFEKKLETDSSNSAVHYYLADCRFHLKEYLKARELLQKIVSNPKDAYYQRAVELMKKIDN